MPVVPQEGWWRKGGSLFVWEELSVIELILTKTQASTGCREPERKERDLFPRVSSGLARRL